MSDIAKYVGKILIPLDRGHPMLIAKDGKTNKYRLVKLFNNGLNVHPVGFIYNDMEEAIIERQIDKIHEYTVLDMSELMQALVSKINDTK